MGDRFLPDRKAHRGHCPFSNPPPTEPSREQGGVISKISSTWQTLFALPWRSPKIPSHPTYKFTQPAPYEWLVLAHASQRPTFSQRRARLNELSEVVPLAEWPQA